MFYTIEYVRVAAPAVISIFCIVRPLVSLYRSCLEVRLAAEYRRETLSNSAYFYAVLSIVSPTVQLRSLAEVY